MISRNTRTLKPAHRIAEAHLKKESLKPEKVVAGKQSGVALDMGSCGHDRLDDGFETF